MKRISNIFILLIFLSLSGCWTKVYLGKEKEPDMTFSDDMAMSSRAIDPTTVPAGGTWGTVRGILNSNFGSINGTLDSLEAYADTMGLDIDTLEVQTLEFIDSLAAHRTELDGKLNMADSLTMYVTPDQLADSLAGFTGGGASIDTTSLSARIDLKAPIANPTFTGTTTGTFSGNLTGNVTGNVSGSAGTIINSTTSTGGNVALVSASSPTSIHYSPDLQYTELLGVLSSTNFLAGSITSGSYYGANSILSLSSASNIDFTITPKGTGVIKKSSTDTLATQAYARQFGGTGTVTLLDVQSEIADSLVNYVATKDSTGIKPGSYVSGYTFQQGMINKVSVSDTAAMLAHYALLSEIGTGGDISTLETRVDSIVDVLADSINIETLLQVDLSTDTLSTKAYARSVGGGGSGVTGVTLNSGKLTLTGDLATADSVSFYTNGNGEYNLPSGGGNLTIQSQVQGWINDSLDVLRTADSDTIPLFIFGFGSGHSSDTAIFNNGRLAGAFYNSGSDTLYVTELRGVLVEGTGTETIDVQVSWSVNMKDATATNLNTTALTVTSMTTGTADTTFDNNGIPPDTWVWCTLSGASANNKPTMLTLTMTGYRRNRSY